VISGLKCLNDRFYLFVATMEKACWNTLLPVNLLLYGGETLKSTTTEMTQVEQFLEYFQIASSHLASDDLSATNDVPRFVIKLCMRMRGKYVVLQRLPTHQFKSTAQGTRQTQAVLHDNTDCHAKVNLCVPSCTQRLEGGGVQKLFETQYFHSNSSRG
jgi:hypothetical protein